MSLSIGIVGLPNVGKSTLFNALLGKAQAAASNFPFCTIEPNVGIVPVPDDRLDVLTKMEGSAKTVPTAIQFVDIAGLVKGANEGQGLGNKFLAYIREADAIIEIVRLFPDENVIHVGGKLDPQDDIATIDTELMLADLQTLEKHLPKVEREAKTDPKIKPKVAFLDKLKNHLAAGQGARTLTVTEEEQLWLKELFLLSSKPILYVANVTHDQLSNRGLLSPIQTIAQAEGAEVIAIDAKIEAEIAELPSSEQVEYLKELGLDEPGLNKVIHAGYRLLNLITFLTTGPDETRAWTVKAGTKAPQAAGIIHTDFERGFIRAEIVSYTDLVAAGSMKKAAELGRVRQEGKDYIMQDGDVAHFKFNV